MYETILIEFPGSFGFIVLAMCTLGVVEVSSAKKASNEQDLEWLERVIAGDTVAYRGLVEKYQSRIYGMVYGMVRNREDASEITQETFVKAYNKLETFRLDSSFYTWIYRIAVNRSIDLLRKKKRRRNSEFDESIATRDGDGSLIDRHHQENPSKALERKQLYGKIMDAMEALPDDQRQVVLMRELDGMSYKEISDMMGIPEGTVMSRLYYARKKLQELLGGLG